MTRRSASAAERDRAKDPAALGRWDQLQFGIDPAPAEYSQRPWSQEILALSIPPR
jgi:predicted HD phosphohydrolase